MMDENDLDIGNGSTGSSNSQSVRKNIPIKLKGGKGGSRKGKKAATPRNKKSTGSRKPVQDESMDDKNDEELPDQLEFSTMKIAATPAEPLHHNHKLKWDHKVNLIGQKVVDPLIHSCEKCGLPILIYGRMIPCKHVFCFDCAKKTEKHCPRCKDTVSRIEQSALGTVFVCTYGGSKHGSTGCHRTYLSQRDLQAHIDHRHIKGSKEKSSASHSSQQTVTQLTVSQKQQSLSTPPQAGSGSTPLMQQTPPQQSVTMPAMSLSHQHTTPDSYAPHSTVATHSNIGSHGSPAPHQTMSMNLGISGPPPQQQPMQDSGMLYHHPHPEEHSQAMLSQAPPGGQIPQHTVPPPLLPPMQHHQQPPPQAPHQTMPPQPNLLPPPPVASTAHTHLPPPAAGSANLDINYHNRPAMGPSRNTNLITVPIQDERDYSRRDQPIVSYSQPAPMVGGAGGLYSHPPPGPPPQGHYTHPPPQHTLPTSSYPGHQLGAAGVNVSLPSTFSSPPPTHAAQYPNNVAQRPHMQVPPPQVGPPPQTGLPPPRPSAQVPPPSNLRPPMSGPPPQIGAPPPHGPPPTQYPPSQRPPGGPFDPQGGSHPWPSPQGPPPRGPPPQRPQTSSTTMGPPPPHGYYQ